MSEEINTTESPVETPKNKKFPAGIIVIIIAIVLTVLIIFALGKSKSKKANAGPGGWGGFGGSQTYSVKTVEAQNAVLHDYVITNGDVETKSSVQVFPTIGGKVVETKVSLGTSVKKGDVIAKIDPSTAGSYYALSAVTAPISGSILSAPSKVGNQVMASTVITTIGDIENLQVTARIPERYVAALKPGLKAEITLEAYAGVVFTATVIEVSPVLDSATRTKQIVLDFDKKDDRINAGMFARVKLYTLDYEGELVIPQKAIVTNNSDSYVFVTTDMGTVEKKNVKTGMLVDGYIQITEGISAGDKVVSEGMLSLFDGAKILDITNGVPKKEAEADADKKTEAPAGEDIPGHGEEKPQDGKKKKGGK